MRLRATTLLLLSIMVIAAIYLLWPKSTIAPTTNKTPQASEPPPTPFITNFPSRPTISSTPPASLSLAVPVPEFQQRITKKPFGLLVTPDTSPIQPERFSGYHTGVDVEYDDIDSDVIIQAIAAGQVLVAKHASGYGGVVAIQHNLGNQPLIAIYGHLNPEQLPAAGSKVTAGQSIGILGQGYTAATDGERKHLHFGILPGTTVDLRGYVDSTEELTNWLNPTSLNFN